MFREVYQGMSKWVKTGELGPIITCIQTRCLTHLQSLRKQTCPELQKIVTRKLTSSTEKKKKFTQIQNQQGCILYLWQLTAFSNAWTNEKGMCEGSISHLLRKVTYASLYEEQKMRCKFWLNMLLYIAIISFTLISLKRHPNPLPTPHTHTHLAVYLCMWSHLNSYLYVVKQSSLNNQKI